MSWDNVYSVTLSDEDCAALEAAAKDAGLPSNRYLAEAAMTMVRQREAAKEPNHYRLVDLEGAAVAYHAIPEAR